MTDKQNNKPVAHRTKYCEDLLDLQEPGKHPVQTIITNQSWLDDKDLQAPLIAVVGVHGGSTDPKTLKNLADDFANVAEKLDEIASIYLAVPLWLDQAATETLSFAVGAISEVPDGRERLAEWISKAEVPRLAAINEQVWLSLIAHRDDRLRLAAIYASPRRESANQAPPAVTRTRRI